MAIKILTGILIVTTMTLAGLVLWLQYVLRGCQKSLVQVQTALTAKSLALELNAEQWRAILHGMPDGLMVLDPDLRLIEWNEHFPEFVGVPPEVLHIGMPLADILRIQAQAGEFGPVDVEQEVERRVSMIKSGVSTGTIERRRPNNRIMELRRKLLPNGGFVTLYTDITERRRAEDQLRQAQKMEAIGQLTGGLAHDFNNLLTVVMGNIEISQNAMQASNLLRAQSKLEDARAGAERGAILTKRLLAYSRRQTLEPQAVDVNKTVTNMSALIRGSIGAVNLEAVLAGGLWQTFIDPNQLENALLNLAINARDAMSDGGKITIETANTYLDASYAAAHNEVSPGQYVMIALSDGGTGMSQDAQDRAFEPFFTTKEIGKGSGLGLSQVFGFIKQSKGHVKIYSEINVGTTVKLYLPRFIADASSASETAALPSGMPRAKDGEAILVVEDDPAVLAYTKDVLESLGYHVIAAADAESALLSLDTHKGISLLFTDVQLPELNGPDLVDAVLQRRSGLPVLYTTGYPAMAILHRGLLARDVRSINKPFMPGELATAIREAIDASVSS